MELGNGSFFLGLKQYKNIVQNTSIIELLSCVLRAIYVCAKARKHTFGKEVNLDMFKEKFGIEIEFTGITRNKASKVVAELVNGTIIEARDYYDTKEIKAFGGRKWKVMYDGSLRCQTKRNGEVISAGRDYSCELVSPILTYEEDIETLHDVRTIRNFINIIASKNDLLYKALEIKPERMRFCKKMDEHLVTNINKKHPMTLAQLADIWYQGYYGSRNTHYHDSRYHFLNLHSFFTGNHTVELRGFNSELHAGKVRSYICLALALNHQALTQKCASSKKPQVENEKFAMRTYLNRIGMIGEEFKNCRVHLTNALSGCSAWRFGRNEATLGGAR